ncbi:MAG: hypothetical protein ACT4OY_03325 [Alphaproteobacteria bacterium]
MYLLSPRMRYPSFVVLAYLLAGMAVSIFFKNVDLVIGSILILIALGLRLVNEIFEFATVKTLLDTNVGGYINIAWNLVANAIGAFFAVLYLKFYKQG